MARINRGEGVKDKFGNQLEVGDEVICPWLNGFAPGRIEHCSAESDLVSVDVVIENGVQICDQKFKPNELQKVITFKIRYEI